MNDNLLMVWPPVTQPPVPGPDRVEGHPGPREKEDGPVPMPARFEIYRDGDGWRLHDRDRNRSVRCRSHSEAVDRMNTRMIAEMFGRRAA